MVQGRQHFVRLLDGPVMDIAERHVPLTGLQGWLTALAYLSGAGGISRMRAADLLWGRADESKARRRLSQLLYDLTQRVGVPVFSTTPDHILPVLPHDLDGDHLRNVIRDWPATTVGFRELSVCGLLGEAPTPEAESALAGYVASLRTAIRRLAARQWDEAERVGDWPKAESAGLALVAIDQFEPKWIRRLFHAYLAAGRWASAESLLKEAPLHGFSDRDVDELRHTATSLRLGGGERTEDRALAAYNTPLLGRAAVVEQLVSLASNTNGMSFQVLVGAPGMGKTRVLREAALRLSLRGIRVVWSECNRLEHGIPLATMIDCLARTLTSTDLAQIGQPWRSVIADLLDITSDQTVPPVALPPEAASSRLLPSLMMALEQMCVDRPTAVLVDDAHWIDPTSLAAFQYAHRRWHRGRLMLIFSGSLEDPSAPILQFQNRRHSRVFYSSLRPLRRSEARRLVVGVAPESLSHSDLETILDTALGNPLQLIALAVASLNGDRLTAAANVTSSHWDRQLRPVVGSLSPAARRALAIICLHEGTIPLSDIAMLSGTTVPDLSNDLDSMFRTGLLIHNEDSVRIRHRLIEQSAVSALGSLLIRHAHRSIGRFLASRVPPRVGEAAIHLTRGGLGAQAADLAEAAADHALGRGAFREGLRFLRLTVECRGDKVTGTHLKHVGQAHLRQCDPRGNSFLRRAERRFSILGNRREARACRVLHLDARSESGDLPHSIAAARLAAEAEASLMDQDSATFLKAAESRIRVLERDGSLEMIPPTLARVSQLVPDLAGRDRCSGMLILALECLYGRPERSVESARAARLLATDLDDQKLILQANHRLFIALMFRGLGSNKEAVNALKELLEYSEDTGDLRLQYTTRANHAVWLIETGEYDAAEHALQGAARFLDEAVAVGERINLQCNLGEIFLARRQFDKALHAYQEAENLLNNGVRRFLLDVIHAGLGTAALETGRLELAKRCHLALNDWSHWYFDPSLILTFKAKMLCRAGRVEDGLRQLDQEGTRIARRFPAPAIRVAIERERLARRFGTRPSERSGRALTIAERLNLKLRAEELGNLLSRA